MYVCFQHDYGGLNFTVRGNTFHLNVAGKNELK